MNSNIVTLRAIAILIVVLGHSIILYDPEWRVYEPINGCSLFQELKRVINLLQMPLFFSISGYLFYFTSAKYSLAKLVQKKIRRILIPYFFIAFLWMDPIKLLLHVPGHDNYFELVKEQIVGNMNGHLWYLYTLFALFVVFAFVRLFLVRVEKGILNRNVLNIFILLFLMLCNVFSGVFGRFANVASYAIFFYVGFLMNEYSFLFVNNRKSKFLITSIIVMVIFTVLLLLGILPYRVARCFIACAFLVVIYNIDFGVVNNIPCLKLISSSSFGIYLFHSPLIYITCTYWRDCSPLFVLFMNFFVFGVVAFIISYDSSKEKPGKIYYR